MDREQLALRPAEGMRVCAEQVQKSSAASRIGAQRAEVRYRQGGACGEIASIAPCHIATGFGIKVGARPADIRPSYPGARQSAM